MQFKNLVKIMENMKVEINYPLINLKFFLIK